MNLSTICLISALILSASCSKISSKECSKELEAIIYHPPNGAFDYMAKLTDQLIISLNLP